MCRFSSFDTPNCGPRCLLLVVYLSTLEFNPWGGFLVDRSRLSALRYEKLTLKVFSPTVNRLSYTVWEVY